MKQLPTLHILNGDASLPAFTAAKLPGQVLVWREILSEGPVVGFLPEQEFWQMRQRYITSTFSESAESYKAKVLDELPKLTQAKAFFEVVLWFDADLMCQLNLLYLLHKLQQHQPALISVCTPANNEYIALLSEGQLQQVFKERQRIEVAHLHEARSLWQLYTGTDPMVLQTALLAAEKSLLPYLQVALQLHLTRFPDCQTGLSIPQRVLLQLVQQKAPSQQQLMEEFWQQQPAYGFGDRQLERLIKSLQPALIAEEKALAITAKGTAVLQGQENYREWLSEEPWLGGVKLKPESPWCYNVRSGQLTVPHP